MNKILIFFLVSSKKMIKYPTETKIKRNRTLQKLKMATKTKKKKKSNLFHVCRAKSETLSQSASKNQIFTGKAAVSKAIAAASAATGGILLEIRDNSGNPLDSQHLVSLLIDTTYFANLGFGVLGFIGNWGRLAS